MIHPFTLMAKKTKLIPGEVLDLSLRNLIWLDVLSDGKADEGICEHITRTLVVTQIISVIKQHRALYDVSCIGIKAFIAAIERKDAEGLHYIALTPEEFNQVKKVMLWYDHILPQIDTGTLVTAADKWTALANNFVSKKKD